MCDRTVALAASLAWQLASYMQGLLLGCLCSGATQHLLLVEFRSRGTSQQYSHSNPHMAVKRFFGHAAKQTTALRLRTGAIPWMRRRLDKKNTERGPPGYVPRSWYSFGRGLHGELGRELAQNVEVLIAFDFVPFFPLIFLLLLIFFLIFFSADLDLELIDASAKACPLLKFVQLWPNTQAFPASSGCRCASLFATTSEVFLIFPISSVSFETL